MILALAALAAFLAGGVAALLFVGRQRSILRRLYDRERDHSAATRHFDRLFAMAREMFLLTDPSGRIIEANEAAVAAYGYPRDELLGMTPLDLRVPEARATYQRDVAAANEPGGTRFETVHRRQDGTTFPVEISTRSLEIDGQRFRQSIVRDITEQKQAAAALLERMDELRRWNAAAVDREERIIGLKQEVNELLVTLGLPPRYANGELDGGVDG